MPWALSACLPGEHLIVVLDSGYVYKGIMEWSPSGGAMGGGQRLGRWGIEICGEPYSLRGGVLRTLCTKFVQDRTQAA